METEEDIDKLYKVRRMMEEEDIKFDEVTSRLNAISNRFTQGNQTLQEYESNIKRAKLLNQKIKNKYIYLPGNRSKPCTSLSASDSFV